MLKKRIFLIITLIINTGISHTMNINAGYTLSKDIVINTHTFVNSGTMKAFLSVNITVNTIKGNGTISGKTITIICDTFDYKGTIECHSKCVIHTKKAFNSNMFTKKGKGSFTVIVSPYEFKSYSEPVLFYESCEQFRNNCLTIADETIDKKIQEIRVHAALNNINENKLLNKLKNEIAMQAEYHENRFNEKYDTNSLRNGFMSSGIGLGGLGVVYTIYKFRTPLQKYVSTDPLIIMSSLIGIASLLALSFTPNALINGLNPKHKERYEKLTLVRQKLELALSTPRIKEEQIIKLQ